MLKEIWKSIFCFMIVLSSFSASATCLKEGDKVSLTGVVSEQLGNDSNLLIVFYVQIMPDDFVMQLHRF